MFSVPFGSSFGRGCPGAALVRRRAPEFPAYATSASAALFSCFARATSSDLPLRARFAAFSARVAWARRAAALRPSAPRVLWALIARRERALTLACCVMTAVPFGLGLRINVLHG